MCATEDEVGHLDEVDSEAKLSFPNFIIQFLGQSTVATLAGIQKSVNDTVRVVNELQKNLNNIFQQLLTKVQLDNVILPPITLAVGNNIVQHSLGRKLTGWQIIDMSGNFSELISYQVADTNYFYIHSTTVSTVTFMVF